MVLEATVVCLDNSDWMRNGDYTPTRLEAQHDAVNLLCGAKTQSNPESTVGAIACAGKTPEVLVTLTPDLGKILSSIHNLQIGGSMNFAAGLQVAQLALKHRQNKNQHQRIVVFVGSPLKDDKEELVRLAKRLKKNNIAVDVVNFGEEGVNTEKLEAFVNAVNSNDNSHLVTVPPGPHILSDILISSPIISEDGGAGAFAAGGGGGGGAASDFGFDPNLDPELALAIKLSMEEDRARQEAETRRAEEASGATGTPSATKEVQMTDSSTPATAATDEDDELFQQALALSMAASAPTSTSTTTTTTATTPTAAPPASTPGSTTTTTTTTPASSKDVDMQEIDDDEEMRLALQMSLQAPPSTTSTASSTTSTSSSESVSSEDINRVMEDPNFVNSVLMSLPGVDPNDERIKSVLQSFQKGEEDKDKKDKK